ncbi:SDR family oxidoreductase [Gelidibacter sp.]|uniref:SDR family NAD(P)-dependent oxidoreductase n=1 Tax=Gelidibacter sp. TaxID=2018083 RepID=UPI003265D128
MKNQVAIITGGSEGIGLSIASALATQGTHVYLVSRTLEKLEKAKEKILQQGGKADIKSADITNIDAMKDVIESVYKTHGRLDIFINNAGTWQGHSLDTPFADIWKLIELDMKAPYEIAHYLAGRFKEEKNNDLRILTIVSQAALQVLGNSLGYGVAKMGLAAGLFHIEKELQKEGIQNVKLYRLYPNTVATEKMMDAVRANQVKDAVSPETVADTAIDLLSDTTPTRDARIGYYIDKGIVRSYYPSTPQDFYHPAEIIEDVIDPDFTIQDLLK